MKLAIQYLNDVVGNIQAVQIPITQWESVLNKLNKYEQALKLKSDLQEAFKEVAQLRKSKKTKQTLNEFLNDI